ncbi:Tetratricopeptide repeat domain 27 [Mactra antiquata]
MTDILSLEISLLAQEVFAKDGLYAEVIQHLIDGKFDLVLKTDFARKFFRHESYDSTSGLKEWFRKNIDNFFETEDENELQKREFECLMVAVSCLQLFVQNNWLGPRLSDFSPKNVFPESVQNDNFTTVIEGELNIDGEPLLPQAIYPEFLYVARTLLSDFRQHFKYLQTIDWWMLRCINIYQQVIDGKSNTLREEAIKLLESVSVCEPLMTAEKYRDLQIQFHIEAGHISHMYYRYREAEQHFNTAKKLSGLTVEFTGAMGKKTKFQQTDKAQLLLKVSRNPDISSNMECLELEKSDKQSILPKNLNLDDDTLLENISFTDTEAGHITSVSSIEQSLILGLMEDYRRSRASSDFLTEEEIEAYLTYVLSDIKNWSVSCSALYLRSKLQKGSRRRVERSMRQLEELYNQTTREAPPCGERFKLFYSLIIVPVWEIQNQLAEILLSLGAIGSGLEIYEQLKMWEQAIACYQRLGKSEKAETLIREQLTIKETPNLWCFLGDITRNIEHYEKAWELSKNRSARAQRCMGYLYFGKEDYDKCLECFEKSLNVNALQVPVWFTYGCAAMAAKKFDVAIKGFKRCVTIDYDNYEAWNNLASAYIKIGEKKKAFTTLNDALRCDYENWRVWENYLLTGTDCGEFGEVIKAYNRLIDIKEKWIDEQILGILVRVVNEDIKDADGNSGKLIEPKLRELFGRVTAKVTNNSEIWRLYGQLCSNDPDKMLQYLQKSHRCVMQTSNYEKDLEQCQKVAKQSLQLAQTYCNVCSKSEDTKQSLMLMSSAKLMIKGVFTKIKQHHTDPVTQTIPNKDIEEICTELEQQLNDIMKTIEQLKAS